MTREEAIEIIRENCYVFNPLDFDETTRINTALDIVLGKPKAKGSDEILNELKEIRQNGACDIVIKSKSKEYLFKNMHLCDYKASNIVPGDIDEVTLILRRFVC